VNVTPPDGRVAGIVLAAGRSQRMGAANKLLESYGGAPLVRHAACAALAGGLDPVMVVTGHDHLRVTSALAGLAVHLTHNPDYDLGLAGSLRHGLTALPDTISGVAVLLGDMPLVDAALVRRLAKHLDPTDSEAIVVPLYQGRRGNPVVWGRAHIPTLTALEGDRGARDHLERQRGNWITVEVFDAAAVTDIDTPAALAALRDAAPG